MATSRRCPFKIQSLAKRRRWEGMTLPSHPRNSDLIDVSIKLLSAVHAPVRVAVRSERSVVADH
jgi:hypothetical protein